MTFLVPLALVVGALGVAGVVVLHLVARQRPAEYLLPTTRFIPDRRALVSRITTQPRDLPLLLLRVLLLASAAAAFARPVLSPSRAPRARVLLLDRSADVANAADAIARARAVLADGVPTHLVAFDSGAALLGDARSALDSLARDTARVMSAGSLSAALISARRAGASLAGTADSVELVVVSPVAARALDAATDSVRARWPGRIGIVRLSARTDSAATPMLERAVGADDPLVPALAGMRVGIGATAIRLRRTTLDARDSAFVRGGGALVRWDSAGAMTVRAEALAMGDDVLVAMLGRGAPLARGRTIARWLDGAAAAVEEPIGAGCIRTVAVSFPPAGDVPLRPAFQRIVRGVMSRCDAATVFVLADEAALGRLRGKGALASTAAMADGDRRPSPIVPWLLGVALACALAELAVRARWTRELA